MMLPQAASGKRQAASGKRQAASGKRQAASGKRQAASGKRQAASGKRQAASRKPQAASRKQASRQAGKQGPKHVAIRRLQSRTRRTGTRVPRAFLAPSGDVGGGA
ncbi:6-phosphofructokinase [Burkholderia multivorans]|uniref:6-phosphofructokinase n=1 Tax=Burkholderia multivorans TaxID=87883 RepID=A0AAP2HHR8_9BURK|nr:6-phosphofructokinase [Burkholderia multivorans]MBU9356391.1 6-phosphofructokinase [Burkholderia multivorans]